MEVSLFVCIGFVIEVVVTTLFPANKGLVFLHIYILSLKR